MEVSLAYQNDELIFFKSMIWKLNETNTEIWSIFEGEKLFWQKIRDYGYICEMSSKTKSLWWRTL